jgi:hypothetical protein
MGNAMKTTLHILTGLFLLLASCNNSTTDYRKNYIESEPTFFELRNGDWLTNKWIRKPENLLAIHETFKKFGYWKLITNELLDNNPFILQDIYINKKGLDVLDSLELTYNNPSIEEKYYKEFWQRRKAENNDSIVFVIITEIRHTLVKETGKEFMPQNTRPELVNDTLLKLLEIEYRQDSLTPKLALNDFIELKRLGFHESAYNLLFEKYNYQDINWNKDSLVRTLKQTDKYVSPWFQDNTP